MPSSRPRSPSSASAPPGRDRRGQRHPGGTDHAAAISAAVRAALRPLVERLASRLHGPSPFPIPGSLLQILQQFSTLLHEGFGLLSERLFVLRVSAANRHFSEWAMLGSNQRPLPCESSTIVFWRFPKVAKCLRIEVLGPRRFSQTFRIFTHVAAQSLYHNVV